MNPLWKLLTEQYWIQVGVRQEAQWALEVERLTEGRRDGMVFVWLWRRWQGGVWSGIKLLVGLYNGF